METLLKGPVQFVQPHSLPFRAIFEEHLRRNRIPLGAVQKSLGAGLGQKIPKLREEIERQENAYAELVKANDEIGRGRNPATSVDELVAKCKESDDKLKAVMHAMDCSALCLSGGGIRSASFCLGVLEGLARFSNPDQTNGLMYGLDYLSTVSGGGYIGSWMTTWIHQRRKADGDEAAMKALAALEECAEKLKLIEYAHRKLRLAGAEPEKTGEFKRAKKSQKNALTALNDSVKALERAATGDENTHNEGLNETFERVKRKLTEIGQRCKDVLKPKHTKREQEKALRELNDNINDVNSALTKLCETSKVLEAAETGKGFEKPLKQGGGETRGGESSEWAGGCRIKIRVNNQTRRYGSAA
jgi:hypothetical protein